MDLKQLQYFVQVCKYGNITKAASSLYISQQALSSSLSRLEKEIGFILIKRSSSGIILTNAGAYFQMQAQKILDIENETRIYLDSLTAAKPNLKIGCSYGVVGELAAQLLNNAQLSKNNIHLKILEYADCICEEVVANEEVDVGFAIGPVDQDYFDSHFLLRRRYCFVVHRSHPLASYDTIDISQLQGENIMIMNESFKVYHILMSLCKKKGFKPKFTYEAGEIAPIQNLVIKKYGVGISTEFVAKKHQLPETKILFVNDPAFSWNIYLISKKQKTLSKEARTFIDYIQKSSPIT